MELTKRDVEMAIHEPTMSSTMRAKATLQTIVDLYGVEGVLAYARLADEFGPATVHRYLLDVLQRRVPPVGDPRRI